MAEILQKFGSFTPVFNPTKMSSPEATLSIAAQPTYSGSAIFVWGLILQGTQVTLEWDGMSEADYQSFRALFIAGVPILWDLGVTVAGGRSFNVMILKFTGEYIDHQILYDGPWRINCKMELDIRSKVS